MTNALKEVGVRGLAGLLFLQMLGCTPPPEKDRLQGPTKGFEVVEVDFAVARDSIEAGTVRVLDVRTPGEFATGFLPGAVNLDSSASDFEQSLSRLDRNASYLIYCRSGNRSRRALRDFERLGFESVLHLEGGINAWVRAGQPVEK